MAQSHAHDDLAPVVSEGAAVLLLGPSRHETGISLRRDLARATDSVPDLLVWVTYDHPATLLEEWDAHVASNPWRLHLVPIGTNHSTSATALRSDAPPDVDVDVAPDRQTSDLTGIGIEITKALPTEPAATGAVLVYVDSITPLVVVNDRKRVYRFLHILLQRFRTAGAVGLVHLDPTVHDQQTMATLSSLFDTVIEFDDDGWSIR